MLPGDAAAVPFVERLAAADRSLFLSAARPVRAPARAELFEEGQRIGGVPFVTAGDVRVYKTGPSGRDMTLYHVTVGETCLVSMLAALLRAPAMASARVESAVEAVVLPSTTFQELVRRSDPLRELAFTSMAGRLVDVMTLVGEIAFSKVDERLLSYLRGRLAGAAGPAEIAVTHEAIAAELGTAREVVSRLLEELQRSGALELSRGRIRLRDAAALGALPRRRGR